MALSLSSKFLARVLPVASMLALFATGTAAQSLKATPSNTDIIDLLKDPMAIPGERVLFPGFPPIPELAVHPLYDNIFTNQPLLMDAPPYGISFSVPATGIAPFIGGVPDRPLDVPLNENDFISGRTAAIQLGKALFWDMQVGSDGVQACGSCHFHAGADNRVTNQINPGTFDDDGSLEVRGKNDTLVVSDFPTHKLLDVMVPGEPLLNPDNIERDSNDVVSSMGVIFREFVDIEAPGPGAFIAGTNPPVLRPDIGLVVPDPVGAAFQDVRRVEPRNTPTFFAVANNFDNFWDGRARHDFNGGSPHGASDPYPHIFEDDGSGLVATRQLIRFSSTASLATGPALSNFEMSFDKRSWPKIAKKLLQSGVVPLANQLVDPTDSVLGSLSNQNLAPGRPGLTISYGELLEAAFDSRLWSNTTEHLEAIADAADPLDGESLVLSLGSASASDTSQFTQAEANFSLFFGLSVQAYAQILLPNDSPFDRFHDANPDEFLGLVDDIEPGTPGVQVVGLSDRQLLGYDIFQGTNLSQQNPLFKAANCNICHFGPELTENSITGVLDIFPANLITGEDRQLPGFLLENRLKGPAQNTMELDGLNPSLDGLGIHDGHGLSDKGVYNIGVRPLSEDISRGADDAFGFPLSLAALSLQAGGYPVGEFSDPLNPLAPLPPHLAPYVNDFPTGIGFPNINLPIFLPDTISPTVEIVVHPSGTYPVPNRVTRMGNFKVSHLKNVELTGPYFHNGGMSTLRQVIDFYARGGDFPITNGLHRDPLIFDLNVNFGSLLVESDKVALVDFMLAMTDERVKFERAPFDHPEIIVPVDGTAPDNTAGRTAMLSDARFLRVPATGAAGRSTPLKNFLGISSIEGSAGADHFDSVTDVDPLAILGPFPGVAGAVNEVTVMGADPFGRIGLIVGLTAGSTMVQLPGCGTVEAGLERPFYLFAKVADAAGKTTFSLPTPPEISGLTFFFQAIQPDSCLISDVSNTTF
jgi:cytochrome c peroxidase